MNYALHIATAAERDIRDAADYIEFALMNPQAANDLLDAISEILPTLEENPTRIGLVSEPVLNAWGIRFIRIKNYLAFFVVDEEAQSVTVLRFLYVKRNWIGLLKGIDTE